MALGGKDAIPAKPIRIGATDASIFLDLGGFTVERRFTEAGNSYLEVKNKDGFSAKSPQGFLSSKLGGYASNPLEFMRLKPDEQVKALQSLITIKLDKKHLEKISGLSMEKVKIEDPIQLIEAVYKHLFEKRTEVNSEAKRLAGAVDTAKARIPAGKETTGKVSVSELFEERKKLEVMQKANDSERSALTNLLQLQAEGCRRLAKIERQIEETRAILEALERERLEIARTIRETVDLPVEKQQQVVAVLRDPDFSEIDARIAAADEINALAAIIETYQTNLSALESKKAESEGMSGRLGKIKEYKGKLIVEAGLPVEGLGFEGGEVTYNGVPLSQSSTSEQIQISCAICMSAHPDIRVLSVDIGWNELDSDGKAALTAWAEQNECQIWITKVTDEADADGFHIVDGEIAAINGQPAMPEVDDTESDSSPSFDSAVNDEIPF